MPEDWKDISDDDILNFEGSQTAQISRFDRIMQRRTQESLAQVQEELSALGSRIGSSTDRLVGTGNRLIHTIEAEAKVQSRHQNAILALTGGIVLATILYTWITWMSVEAMREANEIQRQQIQATTAETIE